MAAMVFFALIFASAGAVLAVLCLRWKERVRAKTQASRLNENERHLRQLVAEKAANAQPFTTTEDHGLSDAGQLAVVDEIERCIEASDWTAAENWALYGIEAMPDEPVFQVKLAEIYVGEGRVEDLARVLPELKLKFSADPETLRRLEQLDAA